MNPVESWLNRNSAPGGRHRPENVDENPTITVAAAKAPSVLDTPAEDLELETADHRAQLPQHARALQGYGSLRQRIADLDRAGIAKVPNMPPALPDRYRVVDLDRYRVVARDEESRAYRAEVVRRRWGRAGLLLGCGGIVYGLAALWRARDPLAVAEASTALSTAWIFVAGLSGWALGRD